MTMKHITMVLDADGLTPSERMLLIAYANHTDDHGYCWPSISRLMDETGMSRATVKRTNASLREKRLIKSVHRANPKTGKQITNLTRLNIPLLAGMRRPERDYGDNLIEEITFDEDDASSQVSQGAQSEPPRGLNTSPGEAQIEPPRGLNTSPKPLKKPLMESPPPALLPPQPNRVTQMQEEEEKKKKKTGLRVEALALVDAAVATWVGHHPPTAAERRELAQRAAEALRQGAAPEAIHYALTHDLEPGQVRSAVAVVMARTAMDGWADPAPEVVQAPAAPMPPWCGRCDSPDYRWIQDDDGRVRRCPDCHPYADQSRPKGRQDAESEAGAALDNVVSGLEEFRRRRSALRRA